MREFAPGLQDGADMTAKKARARDPIATEQFLWREYYQQQPMPIPLFIVDAVAGHGFVIKPIPCKPIPFKPRLTWR